MRLKWPVLILISITGLIMLISINAAGDNGEVVYSHPGADFSEKAAEDSCFSCHEKDVRKADVESDELCRGCHQPVDDKGALKYQHVAVISEKYPNNDCEGCHRMHRSPAKPQLAENELELCYGCHPEERDYKSHPVVIFTDRFGQTTPIFGADGKSITCASHCHEIHGSDYKYLCSLEPGRELCVSCHEEFR